MKKKRTPLNPKSKRKLEYTVIGILFLLAYTFYIVCYWSVENFDFSIDQIVFTLTNPIEGSDNSTLYSVLSTCLPRVLIVIVLYIILTAINCSIKSVLKISLKLKKRVIKIDFSVFLRRFTAVLSVVSLISSFIYADSHYGIVEHVKNRLSETAIYKREYVDPKDADITLATKNGKYKNLIYIYLESMETTYTSKADGGHQKVSYIPNLSRIAKENISFSNTEKLGGFRSLYGTTYTSGALLATSSGIPYAFDSHANDQIENGVFAKGLTTLGDILNGFGYNQEFLCGSDAEFGNRKMYFTQHGNYEIFDLFTAREKGYIDEDYFVFWGYEDMYLYEIAKDELLRLSQMGEPFNLTMLTVDTHHISGNICPICENTYDMQVKNVISCADRQIAEFVNWLKEQSFYKDTVIVISGDHPRMDTDIVDGVFYPNRTIYNCFINSVVSENIATKNRDFTAMDMFPTTLAAMGFKWNGDRLGLGTNLFSSSETLSEKMGFEKLDTELNKKSTYYLKEFS